MREIGIDIFTEDRAGEELVKHLVKRLAEECGKAVILKLRSVRGGHPRALDELEAYQKFLAKSYVQPSLIVVVIDGNCLGFVEAQKKVRRCIHANWSDRVVIATPDPHIERWYLADLEAFHGVVGYQPSIKQAKCDRDYYKAELSKAIVEAGHPPTLGGLEFARELVQAMDYYRAGRTETGLKHFIDELRARLNQL